MADDYQDIRVTSWFGTFERELARSLGLAVTYQGNRADNLPMALNVNLAQDGTLPDGRPRYSTANRPNPRFGNIFVSQSIGDQRYDGLVTVVTKRFSKGTSFQLSHHLSKSRGLSFVNDFTGFGVFTSPSDPRESRGRSRAVRLRHAPPFLGDRPCRVERARSERGARRARQRLAGVEPDHRVRRLPLQRDHGPGHQRRHDLQRSAGGTDLQLLRAAGLRHRRHALRAHGGARRRPQGGADRRGVQPRAIG